MQPPTGVRETAVVHGGVYEAVACESHPLGATRDCVGEIAGFFYGCRTWYSGVRIYIY